MSEYARPDLLYCAVLICRFLSTDTSVRTPTKAFRLVELGETALTHLKHMSRLEQYITHTFDWPGQFPSTWETTVGP